MEMNDLTQVKNFNYSGEKIFDKETVIGKRKFQKGDRVRRFELVL